MHARWRGAPDLIAPDLAAQVADDAEDLRGGLRFAAALFKAHLLPAALVRGLAADLAAHTGAGPAALHCQPLLAAALVALLQVGWGGCWVLQNSGSISDHCSMYLPEFRHLVRGSCCYPVTRCACECCLWSVFSGATRDLLAIIARGLRRSPSSMLGMDAVQCSAVQCSAVQCSAVQCSAVQCSAVQCSAVQCSAVHVLLRSALAIRDTPGIHPRHAGVRGRVRLRGRRSRPRRQRRGQHRHHGGPRPRGWARPAAPPGPRGPPRRAQGAAGGEGGGGKGRL